MQCTICHCDIQEQTEDWVSTRDSLVVHIGCADKEARIAWAQRQHQALLHVAVLVGLLFGILLLLGNSPVFWCVGSLVSAAHVALHHHWWKSNALTIRRCCRSIYRQIRPWCE
jgi:hypothetical protein